MSVLFYVESDAEAQQCLESARDKHSITVSGYVTDNSIRSYTGVVEYVQDNGETKGRWRWLVSMNERAQEPLKDV